jgi:hypothetical protein
MSVNVAASELPPILGDAFEALKQFAELSTTLFSSSFQGLSSAQMNVRILSAATQIGPVAKNLESKGNLVAQRTAEVDAQLRAVVAELGSIHSSGAATFLAGLVGQMSGLENADETFAQIDEMMSILKTVSVMSSSLRKAIRPALSGVQALRTTFATVNSWHELAPNL